MMRVEDAAAVLGVSLDEITTSSLKQTYQELCASLDPSKVYSNGYNYLLFSFALNFRMLMRPIRKD